jgi:hypothetical protein
MMLGTERMWPVRGIEFFLFLAFSLLSGRMCSLFVWAFQIAISHFLDACVSTIVPF